MRSEDRTGLTPWLLWDFLRLLSGAEIIAHKKNTGSAHAGPVSLCPKSAWAILPDSSGVSGYQEEMKLGGSSSTKTCTGPVSEANVPTSRMPREEKNLRASVDAAGTARTGCLAVAHA